MLKQLLLSTLLFGVSVAVKAQEGTPRPSFFEEERRLTTPNNQEIVSDRQNRQTRGLSDTFLTDALNGVGDPGAGWESRTGLYSSAIDPRTPNPPAVPFGIFTRPPANDSSGIFSRTPVN